MQMLTCQSSMTIGLLLFHCKQSRCKRMGHNAMLFFGVKCFTHPFSASLVGLILVTSCIFAHAGFLISGLNGNWWHCCIFAVGFVCGSTGILQRFLLSNIKRETQKAYHLIYLFHMAYCLVNPDHVLF